VSGRRGSGHARSPDTFIDSEFLLPPGRRLLSGARPAWRRTAFARRTALPLCDASALLLAALLTAAGWSTLWYAATVLIFLSLDGRHRLRICLRVSDEAARLAVAVILPIPLFLFWLDRGTLIRLAVLSGGLLVAMRLTLYSLLRAANRRSWLAERTLIVGTGKLGAEIWDLLHEHRELGLQPVGFIGSAELPPEFTLPVLGTVSELQEVVLAHDVRRVIVTFPGASDRTLVSALRAGKHISAEVCVVPRIYELAAFIPASCQDEIWGIPLLGLRRPGLRWSGRVLKRAFDLVASVLLLIVFGPLLVLLMGGILLDTGRPVLFRQTRMSRAGRTMTITKLRTVTGGDRDGHWTVSPEDCSALGRWLRATHLDELPQLLNVVRGEMSLVGPRPERPFFTSRFAGTVPRYDDRHRAKGGMTGLAQVHGLIGDTSIHERARFDNHYIEHWSFWLDLVILVRTLTEPLTGIRRKSAAPGAAAERPSAPTPAPESASASVAASWASAAEALTVPLGQISIDPVDAGEQLA
jgi:exopolysaccharide biosynthesis polyprenyl glycosylphosphotransferase